MGHADSRTACAALSCTHIAKLPETRPIPSSASTSAVESVSFRTLKLGVGLSAVSQFPDVKWDNLNHGKQAPHLRAHQVIRNDLPVQESSPCAETVAHIFAGLPFRQTNTIHFVSPDFIRKQAFQINLDVQGQVVSNTLQTGRNSGFDTQAPSC